MFLYAAIAAAGLITCPGKPYTYPVQVTPPALTAEVSPVKREIHKMAETQEEEISESKLISKMIISGCDCSGISPARRKVLELAAAQKGIPAYEWGRKYYMLNNFSNSLTNEDALDCSGFVQWVFLNALDADVGEGTSLICTDAAEISQGELLPGDFGLLFKGGPILDTEDAADEADIDETASDPAVPETEGKTEMSPVLKRINHIGIYIGKNSQGRDIWCHCNKKDNTVVIEEYENFTYFCRPEVFVKEEQEG